MKNLIIILVIVLLAVGGYLFYQNYLAGPQLTEAEKACLDSGGSVQKTMCCLSADDFPNLCLIGACGCAAEASHEVKTCDCGEGKCFDGEKCVAREEALGGDCVNSEGTTLSLAEAKQIALESECGEQGVLLEESFCNSGTGTWWIDLEPNEPKEGCNPACVITVETKQAEINWRCTGLILPEEESKDEE